MIRADFMFFLRCSDSIALTEFVADMGESSIPPIPSCTVSSETDFQPPPLDLYHFEAQPFAYADG